MKTQLWNININTNLAGNDWSISMTASEQSILVMLRAAYNTFEGQLKTLADARPGSRPAGLIDEALKLLRCLVFNKLEPVDGKHINISRKG